VKRSQILFHFPTLDMYWTWLSTKKIKNLRVSFRGLSPFTEKSQWEN